MDLERPIRWRGRRKRVSRRLARDLRALLPLLGVLFCFFSSATAIVAAERIALLDDVQQLDFEGEGRTARNPSGTAIAIGDLGRADES